MVDRQIVLVTGVANYWGRRVAAQLVAADAHQIIGLDTEPPEPSIPGLDFVPSDIRNPAIGELLQAEGVETVIHLSFVDSFYPDPVSFDVNVLGTSKLLQACATAGVSKIIVKSSTAIYGARPGNAAFLTESHPLRGSRKRGYLRDLIEMETVLRDFRQQSPAPQIVVLRFASIVGPTANTPMTRFLRDPLAPSLLGFDPRMQIIHEEDVTGALVHAITAKASGIFNVAAEQVLPLNKLRGLAGKRIWPVHHRLAYRAQKHLRQIGAPALKLTPLEPDCLRYPWVADLARMRDDLGFQPRYSAEEAIKELAELDQQGGFLPGSTVLARDEERLREIVGQRQVRKGMAATNGGDDD